MAIELVPLPARFLPGARVGPLTLLGWLPILLIAGLLARLIAVNTYALAVDDGATLWTVSLPWGEMIADRFAMGHLPTFFILFRGWVSVTGTSLLAVRLPSLLLSLMAIPLAGVLAGRAAGARAALIAMAVAALHPTMLRHAAELRMYSWLMVLGALLVLALMRLCDRPAPWRAAAVVVLHLAMLSLHVGMPLVTVPIFAAFVVLGLWKGLPGRFHAWVGVAFLGPILLILPVTLHLRAQLDMKQYDKFLTVDPHGAVVRVIYELMAGIGAAAPMTAMVCVGLLLPVTALALVFVAGPAARSPETALNTREIAAICLATGAGGPLVAYVVSILGPQVLGDSRYFIPSTIPLIALMSAALASIHLSRQVAYVAVVVPFAVFAGMYFDRSSGRTRRVLTEYGSGMNVLVSDLKQQAPAGSQLLVVEEAPHQTAMVNFYLGKDHPFRPLPLRALEPREEAARLLLAEVDPAAPLFYVFYEDEGGRVSSLLSEALADREVAKHRAGRCRWLAFYPPQHP